MLNLTPDGAAALRTFRVPEDAENMKMSGLWAISGAMLAASIPMATAQAQTLTTLYSFTGASGQNPGGLIRDAQGNFYGTTLLGGASSLGVVFEVTPAGTETVLYSFAGADGEYSTASLVRDSAGNLYGTTSQGGASGHGVVFKLDTTGTETVLHSFTGGADGGTPYSGLFRDSAGNLYGTTYSGGASGRGVIFKINASGTEKVLHTFAGGAGGANPYAGLTRDSAGNFYGTTYGGGTGHGLVYKLDTADTYTVLYTFNGLADGGQPYAGVILDPAGNLYGTTTQDGPSGYGVVYELSATGAETVLYGFAGGNDGKNPSTGVIRDSVGNLYGTTQYGGASNNGVVYEVNTAGTETLLHSFTGGSDGANPQAGLLLNAAGDLFGTTYYGGLHQGPAGDGTVFKLAP